MRLGPLILAAAFAAQAQSPDPAARAYDALHAARYDDAVSLFLQAIQNLAKCSQPDPAGSCSVVQVHNLHKDLAYTLLKIGERDDARDHFAQAMRLDPADEHVALEYAFLCYETHQEVEARRVFNRLRASPDPATRDTAAQAFRNIDQPLAAGIQRWQEALARGDNSLATHHELARLAEQHDELALAADHYEKAWRLLPERRGVLIDLGRVWKAMGRAEDATAALLAASRSAEARAAESARELLPARYPFVYEFQNALQLDPSNPGLRREFAFLLLRMNRAPEAEEQFRLVTRQAPEDLLAAGQLGFLYLAHGNRQDAMPLLERVLKGNDDDLANRVRAVLRIPQLERRADGGAQTQAPDAKQMAERSIKAGYLKDAIRYLEIAHEADPVDFSVLLKLGWTYNILHDDTQAARWFELARKSPDPEIASEADRGWRNLRGELERFRTTAWALPTYSTRWRDMFSYGQVKTEWNTHAFVRPYLSARLIADTRSQADAGNPLYFSESALIFAGGLATRNWHGMVLWGEAGSSLGYLSHHVTPDYRGGLALARGWTRGPWFVETTADALFVSRFHNDSLLYAQNRAGYSLRWGASKLQLYWNGNFTVDAKRQYWANFAETGPGLRFRSGALPSLPVISVNFVRGNYTLNRDNPRRPNFFDLRLGLWYALTH
jgi:tetratricopeptide (TPR) repeat protein